MEKFLYYSFRVFVLSFFKIVFRFIRKNIKSIVYISLSVVFFFLGVLGIILPVLPGIPFFVLSFVILIRLSKPFARFVLGSKLGDFLKAEIPVKMKIYIILSVWISMVVPSWFLTSNIYAVGISALLCLILTVYILRIRSFSDLIGDLNGDSRETSSCNSERKIPKEKQRRIAIS